MSAPMARTDRGGAHLRRRAPRSAGGPLGSGFAAGAASAAGLAFVLTVLALLIGPADVIGIVIVLINLLVIGVAVSKRQRGFVAKFAVSYALTFAVLAWPCFEIATKGLRVG